MKNKISMEVIKQLATENQLYRLDMVFFTVAQGHSKVPWDLFDIDELGEKVRIILTEAGVHPDKAAENILRNKQLLKRCSEALDVDFQHEITSLTFYCPGDESYELWRQMCTTCYCLDTLGYELEALTVLGWIKEHAKRSEKFAITQFGSLDHEDVHSVQGIYEV